MQARRVQTLRVNRGFFSFTSAILFSSLPFANNTEKSKRKVKIKNKLKFIKDL